jgi:hypothetical protein
MSVASELPAFAIQLIGASGKPFMTVADQLGGLGSPGTASRPGRPRRCFLSVIIRAISPISSHSLRPLPSEIGSLKIRSLDGVGGASFRRPHTKVWCA